MQSCFYFLIPGKPTHVLGSLHLALIKQSPCQLRTFSCYAHVRESSRGGHAVTSPSVLCREPDSYASRYASRDLRSPGTHNGEHGHRKRVSVRWSPISLATNDRGEPAKPEAPQGQASSSRNLWSVRPKTSSPAEALAKYLDFDDASERRAFYEQVKARLQPKSSQAILLQYLHFSSHPKVQWDQYDRAIYIEAMKRLISGGSSMNDVATWAWVVSGKTADEKVERYLSMPGEKPSFLLLEVLRQDMTHIKTFRKVLVYVWNKDYQFDDPHRTGSLEPASTQPSAQVNGCGSDNTLLLELQLNAFKALLSRLLSHARRIWAPAVVSIAKMVEFYVRSIAHKQPESFASDIRIRSSLSTLVNQAFRLLSLPASIGPLRSMEINWEAQKVLLELVGSLEPALIIDEDSYRAVVRVLLASKKNHSEVRIATHRAEDWPPWRLDQDGMDAQRSPEEDLSRSILAARRSQEAGYRQDAQDRALGILGGMEADGTPTIQTRQLTKRRGKGPAKRNEQPVSVPVLSSIVWAARIEATRDKQEAWNAFSEYHRQDGKPHLSMYLAMFRKLNYDALIPQRLHQYSIPGDGLEVRVVQTDNMSYHHLLKTMPPTFDMLYDSMLQAGLKPQGRCLQFLVDRARTIDDGLRYLRNGDINKDAVDLLDNGARGACSLPLRKIPEPIFAAFMRLLCRFALRRTILRSAVDDPDSKSSDVSSQGQIPGPQLIEMRYRRYPYRNTFAHGIWLLRNRKSLFRPAWYSIFEALAREGIIISPDITNGRRDDDYDAWRTMVSALNHFHESGLELDPVGFQYLCRVFEKFAKTAGDSHTHQGVLSDGALLLHHEFKKLSDTSEAFQYLPKLSHSLNGAHLHAYVRALGAVDDVSGIFAVLEWMVEHKDELEEIAEQTRSGFELFERVIIATRLFLNETDLDEPAKSLAEQVEWWGGWPTDSTVVEYLERGQRVASADGDPEDDTEGLQGAEQEEYESDDEL